ncbi:MAG: porin [Thermodesulfobacteriota bacterium]|nr:porin [Thermodesulfobacteriota bacterium]
MKVWQTLLILILFASLALGTAQPSLATNLAIEKLLEIFEDKGVITASELQAINEAMAEDQKRLLRQEKEMDEREKTLKRWQKELEEKEAALKAKESALSHRQVSPPGKLPAASTTVEGQGEAPPPKTPSLGKKTEEKTPVEASYKNGFCLNTFEPERFTLCLGGLLQADYRYYDYEEGDPEEDRFDLRRTRLLVTGEALGRYEYEFEYEFEGAEARNLLDAYVDAHLSPYASFRIGQFKEPFSLEHCNLDSLGFFAERSMGFYLTPRRDVGFMAHGSLLDDQVHYGLGIFNGDGLDDTPGGDVDSPEYTGRWVLAPFWGQEMPWWDSFQIGGSMSYAKIDRNNVEIQVKTTGMTTFFDVASRGKFNIIRDADDCFRYGAELAWTMGPVALAGEYFHVFYKDITTSAEQFDFEMDDYYVSLLWMLTGEKPILRKGVFQSISPKRSLWEGGCGAVGLAFRYDAFEADDIAYDVLVEAGNSVREADAYTIALNWYLDETVRLVLDATRTDFDQPLLIDRDPITGEAVYSDREDVFTGRFQFRF